MLAQNSTACAWTLTHMSCCEPPPLLPQDLFKEKGGVIFMYPRANTGEAMRIPGVQAAVGMKALLAPQPCTGILLRLF